MSAALVVVLVGWGDMAAAEAMLQQAVEPAVGPVSISSLSAQRSAWQPAYPEHPSTS